MSLESWKAEFYPVEAIKAATDPLTAAKHSLKKWEGARKGNLKKHGVEMVCGVVSDGKNASVFGDSTCALCQLDTKNSHLADEACDWCVLRIARSGARCDRRKRGERSSPYAAASRGFRPTPEPMIRALTKAVKLAEKWAKDAPL